MSSASSWLRLAHQTAIVTGAGSGLGASIAKALALQGVNVVLADTNGEAVEEVARSIAQSHDTTSCDAGNNECNDNGNDNVVGRVEAVVCNVIEPDQVKQLIAAADALAVSQAAYATSTSTTSRNGNAKIGQSSQPIPPLATILINSAGITRDALLPKMSIEDFDAVIGVNLKGSWLTTKYFCSEDRLALLQEHRKACMDADGGGNTLRQLDEEERHPRPSGGGASIINISSVVARTGNVGQTNYGASKGGVIGLTRSTAKEMARWGVRCNAILPGFISTPMAMKVPQRLRDGIQKKIALGSFGRPDDIANLALFLSSAERSGYITGETVEASGMSSL